MLKKTYDNIDSIGRAILNIKAETTKWIQCATKIMYKLCLKIMFSQVTDINIRLR